MPILLSQRKNPISADFGPISLPHALENIKTTVMEADELYK